MTDTSKSLIDSLPGGPIIGHRLGGEYDFLGPPSEPGHLRSAPILASMPLDDEKSRQLRAILTAPDSFGGKGMRCFMPGVGFTISNGAEIVEILVCLRCYWAYFFHGGTRKAEALSEAGHRRLSEFYVEIFPGSNPDTA